MKDKPNPNDDPNKPDNDAEGGEPTKPEGADGWPNLIAEFYESNYATKSRGFLTLYAAHIVFMTRMTGSSRLTAEFLSQKFGRRISRRPVESIINKVRRGEIVITSDELAEIAREHPTAQRFAEHHPEILDPALAVGNPVKKTAVKKRARKTAKKAARKSAARKVAKKAAKKSGKVAKTAAKKKAAKKPRRAPRSGPDPGPELPGFGQ